MFPFIVLAQRVSFVRSTLLCRLHSACARAILFVSCSWCAILLSVSLKCVFLQYFFHSCSLEMFWVVPLRILRDLLFGITPLAFLLSYSSYSKRSRPRTPVHHTSLGLINGPSQCTIALNQQQCSRSTPPCSNQVRGGLRLVWSFTTEVCFSLHFFSFAMLAIYFSFFF